MLMMLLISGQILYVLDKISGSYTAVRRYLHIRVFRMYLPNVQVVTMPLMITKPAHSDTTLIRNTVLGGLLTKY